MLNVEKEIFEGSVANMLVAGFSGFTFSILVIVLGNAATKSQTSIPGMFIGCLVYLEEQSQALGQLSA